MSHDLVHSTVLPKPPGYNLEWPRVTPIQVTLIIGPPGKESHNETHPKQCRNPPHESSLHPKSLGAPLMSQGGTWFQTAWWESHTTNHHAPSSSPVTPSPPSGPNPVATRLA